MKKKKAKKKRINLLWVIITVFIVSSIIWANRSTFIKQSLKFELAQTGTIKHEQKVKVIFANKEVLLRSPTTGIIKYFGEDGQRFRRGENVALIKAEGAAPGSNAIGSYEQTIQAPDGGLFYHKIDGMETLLTSDNLINMDLNQLLTQKESIKNPGEKAVVGQAIGKIVDNLIPTTAFVQLPAASTLNVGDTLYLKINGERQNTKVLRKAKDPSGVVVSFNQFVKGSVEQRRQEIIWISRSSTSGVLVSKSALYTHGEEIGVYVVSEGVIHFREVSIQDEDETRVCITGLPSGLAVVTNPKEGIEGLAVKVKE